MDTAAADPKDQTTRSYTMENNQIQTVIATFAKSNKIGKLKVETFALELLSAARAATGGAPRGKPASESTLQLRKLTLDAVSFGYCTSGDIIKHLNLQNKDAAVHVNNALTYWHKQGKLVISGKDMQHAGKGKKPNIWAVKC